MSAKPPFPWYGGKTLSAPAIWRALGDVTNYVEPFAGGLGALLARPGGAGKVETVNDPTGVACALEGRAFLGVELSEHYAAVARRRIAAACGAP